MDSNKTQNTGEGSQWDIKKSGGITPEAPKKWLHCFLVINATWLFGHLSRTDFNHSEKSESMC